jgi:hypothetical protein
MDDLHEGLAEVMAGLAVFLVVGAIASSFLQRENLVGAMISGYKRGPRSAAIPGTRWPAALMLVVAVAGLWAALVPAFPVPDRHEAAGHRERHSHEHRETQRHTHRDDG